MELEQIFQKRQSRRSILRQLAILTGMGLTLDACHPFAAPTSDSSIKCVSDFIHHVLIASQENRTFD